MKRVKTTIQVPTAADLRASIARERFYLHTVAAELHVHPATLGAYLNERRPLPADLAQRIAEAVDRLGARARGARLGA